MVTTPRGIHERDSGATASLCLGLTLVLSRSSGSPPANTWSAHGRIAFARANDVDGWQVYIMSADGSDPLRLLSKDDSRISIALAWSPDGTRIVFGSHKRGGQTGISDFWVIASLDVSGSGGWTTHLETGATRQLILDAEPRTFPDHVDHQVAWSPVRP